MDRTLAAHRRQDLRQEVPLGLSVGAQPVQLHSYPCRINDPHIERQELAQPVVG